MKTKKVALPVVAAIAATRGMIGFAAGLLLAKRVPKERRTKIGWTLLGLGAASTIPLVRKVLSRHG